MARRIERKYWEEHVSLNIEPKKVIQVFCSIEARVNDWLKKNPDIEVVDLKITGTQDEELVMVVYKIELEEAE